MVHSGTIVVATQGTTIVVELRVLRSWSQSGYYDRGRNSGYYDRGRNSGYYDRGRNRLTLRGQVTLRSVYYSAEVEDHENQKAGYYWA